MKHIVKGSDPSFFQAWKKKNPHVNWNKFSGTDIYKELRQFLINEQTMLCCYCEIALKNGDTHVEHFRPKDTYPAEMFNFQNLFACCEYNDSCGHKKGSNYFDGLISPLDKSCQSRFTYTGNGKIISSDVNDKFAQDTIDILNLNCKRLKDIRKSIIRALDVDGVNSDLCRTSLQNCVKWYHGFFTVIQYMIDKKEES